MRRKTITWILLAGCMTTAAAVPSHADEEFSADYLASAIVEVLHAHGLTVGSYGAARLEGEALIIEDLRAFDDEGGFGFSAGQVRISGIEEEEGVAEPWLGMAAVSASEVSLSAGKYSVQLPGLQVKGLKLQNSNTDEDRERYGYEHIDGPFSAIKISSMEASGASILIEGTAIARIGEFKARTGVWFKEFTFPSSASFEMSGSTYPEAALAFPGLPAIGDMGIKGSFVIDSVTGLATASLSMDTDGHGQALARAAMAGIKRGALAGFSSWMAGDDDAPEKVLDTVRLSRVAVAARGIGWAAPFLMPVAEAADGFLSREAAAAVKAAVNAVPDTDSRAVVAEMEPSGSLPLSGLAKDAPSPAKSLGFQVR